MLKELNHKFGSASDQMQEIPNPGLTTLLSLHGTWHTAPADVDCLEFFPVVEHHILISCKLSCLTRFFSGFKCPLSPKKSQNIPAHISTNISSPRTFKSSTQKCCTVHHLALKQSARNRWRIKTHNDIKMQMQFQPSVLVSYLNPCFF